ncbi:MAG: N-6 DNA methylase [Bacteroidales bacterium]|nr:N-6 DNA methylase [Bacteroidales bacterium]
MSDEANVLLNKAITKAEWQFGLVKKEDNYEDSPYLSPNKKQIARTVFEKKEQIDNTLSIDAIYFSGDYPFIYFKQLTNCNPKIVNNLHRKIWNEGKTPLLAINTPSEIIFYDCFDVPRKDGDTLNPIDNYSDTEADLKRLGELLHQSKIDTGAIWENGQLGKKLKIQNRVDRKLVKNLSDTRDVLYNKFKIPFNVIHDLLGRSLFALYLEDREIYPSKENNEIIFFDLLKTPDKVYRRFNYLKEKLNGDLFPVSKQEERLIRYGKYCNDILQIVRDCFYGNDVNTQQQVLWSMFQFQYIPIELISSIYEEFMSEEGQGEIRKKGAYYTPSMLVDFVLNEVLPWPDKNNTRYDLKILDPACGSGIFLVESYKRLIARWKYANIKEEVTKDVLEDILLNCIHGIELNPDAIKVAAFSLYLTMLNYTNPREVLTNVKFFKPLVRWSDKKELAERESNNPGNNLFQFNTFDDNLDVFKTRFDIVIGNPPWKMGSLEETVKKYISKHNLPEQIMCAYLDKMSSIAPREKIALVSTAKVLFNTMDVYEIFRKRFFKDNSVEAIINLSVIRDVIFKNAKAPAAVIIYRSRESENNDTQKDHIIYCIPKSVKTIKNRQIIIIDASEIKYIPLHEITKNNSRIFKIAMWGNLRDMKLIERIKKIKSIDETIDKLEKGIGLKKKEKTQPAGNPSLAQHYFIPPDRIQQYYTPKRGLKKLLKDHQKYRANRHNIFNKPIVLINEGSKKSKFCCSYIDYKCAYKSSAYGISIRKENVNFHKALVACLNSSLAEYYFFLTSSSWGIDKGGRVQNNDAISFPILPANMQKVTINKLSAILDKIIKIRNNNLVDAEQQIQNYYNQIDEIIFKEFGISNKDQNLIQDVLNYSTILHGRYKASHAENIVKDLNPYVKTFTDAINSLLKFSGNQLWLEILETNNDRFPLKAIAIHSDRKEESSSNKKFDDILNEINHSVYEKHSESVYFRKVIKYYKSNCIYLIKPNQKRFWSISQALNDADELFLEFINR